MPSSFTTNLRLTLPATGENNGTWGTLVNTGITTLIDSSIAGTASVTMTDANYTLTNLNGTTDEARCMFINLTGTLSTTRNVICPSVSKLYFVYNNTSGGQSIVFKTSAGTGITILNGNRAALYCNGTNVVYAFDQADIGSLDVTNLEVTNIRAKDGTASATIANTTGAFTVSAPFATTGNATLGDASTDTVTVNGYMGVGGAPDTSHLLYASNSPQTGTSQNGITSVVTGTSAATTAIRGFTSRPTTAATAFTVTDLIGYLSLNPTKGAGSTITNQHGVFVADQTQGTNNFGVTSQVSSGSNKWNIYASGTANNAFAGNVRIGSTTAPTNALDVTGSFTVSDNVTLGDASTDTVTVNGYLGIGTAANASIAAYAANTALTGTAQGGFYADITGTSAATSEISGFRSSVRTAAAAFTVSDVSHFRAFNATKGAGSTITNQHGVFVADQTQGTNNFGVTSLVSSGANKWNIYASGTAANYFAGNVGVGTTSPNAKLQVTVGTAGRTTYSSDADDIVIDSTGSGSGMTISSDRASYGVIYFADQDSNARGILRYDHSDNSLRFGTGGSEQMRITDTGNVGIGTNAPSERLQVSGGGLLVAGTIGSFNYNGLSLDYTGTTGRIASGNTAAAGSDLAFYTASSGGNETERMRIDSSGNVGINTASPQTFLHVNAASGQRAIFTGASGINQTMLAAYHSTGSYVNINQHFSSLAGSFGWAVKQDTATTGYLSSTTGNVGRSAVEVNNGFVRFLTGATQTSTDGGAVTITEAARIDSSGNLGLGVTPNAWNTTEYRAMQIGLGASFYGRRVAGDADKAGVAANAVFDQTDNRWEYIATDSASRYDQTGGGHYWYSAASGTAGAAITFTDAMALDASGNLGVGVIPAGWTNYKAIGLNGQGAYYYALTASSTSGLSGNGYYNGTNWIYSNSQASGRYEIAGAQHSWFTAPSGTAGNNITFTQAMTLDASGNLLVGKTGNTPTSSAGVIIRSEGYVNSVTTASTNGTGTSYEYYSTGAAAYRFYVGAGGTVFATTTTISAISDQRVKENIRDLDVGLDAVMALKPRKFDWKAGKGKDIKDDRGFIAQEFEQVFPDLIDEWKDPAPEGEEPYKSVRQDLIPVLVKAIQEQQDIISDLRARVAALETN